jgi:ABC-type polysaccharide/polyol phosphate transport system ATPase subunit
MRFKRKSKETMLNFIKSGAITVLISHSIQAIEEICNKVIWLDHGEVMAEGEPEGVIEKYRKEVQHTG